MVTEDGSPVIVTEIEIHQEKLLGKKWRKVICVVFEDSIVGKARMELYVSKDKLQSGQSMKTILLADCVSIRVSTLENRPTIRIQLNNDNSFDISCDQYEQLTEKLSKIAFPKKYVTITRDSMESSISDEEFALSDEYPVMLVTNTLSRKKSMNATSYHIFFGSDLVIRNGDMEIAVIHYLDLVWVAAGENCLGFEVEGDGVYEFVTPIPLVIVESMRCHIRFSCNFTPLSIRTANKYNRCYYPMRTSHLDTPETSNNSTLESQMSKSINEIIDVAETSFSSVSSEKQPEEKKKRRFFEFLRRTNKKKLYELGRPSFEEDANKEWTHLEKANQLLPPNLEDLEQENFKKELEKAIALKMKRHDDIVLLDKSISDEKF